MYCCCAALPAPAACDLVMELTALRSSSYYLGCRMKKVLFRRDFSRWETGTKSSKNNNKTPHLYPIRLHYSYCGTQHAERSPPARAVVFASGSSCCSVPLSPCAWPNWALWCCCFAAVNRCLLGGARQQQAALYSVRCCVRSTLRCAVPEGASQFFLCRYFLRLPFHWLSTRSKSHRPASSIASDLANMYASPAPAVFFCQGARQGTPPSALGSNRGFLQLVSPFLQGFRIKQVCEQWVRLPTPPDHVLAS